jgi:hypothetical protein
MTRSDEQKRDEALKRALQMKPQPHKPLGKKPPKKKAAKRKAKHAERD